MSDTLRGDVAAYGEASGAIGVLALHDTVAPCHRHVVNHPLLHVVLMDTVIEENHFRLICLLIFFIIGVVSPAE